MPVRHVLAAMQPDASAPPERYASASDADFSLLFYGLRGTQLDEEEWDALASTLSPQYRGMNDVFAKRDLAEQMKPQWQKRMEAFKDRYFSMEPPVFLGSYDLRQHVFPLMVDRTQSAPWSLNAVMWGSSARAQGKMSLAVSNMKDFLQFRPADEAAARTLEALSPLQREGKARVFYFVWDVDVGGRTVKAEILRVRLFDYAGNVLGEFWVEK